MDIVRYIRNGKKRPIGLFLATLQQDPNDGHYTIIVGFSQCNSRDKFSKIMAKTIAEGRLNCQRNKLYAKLNDPTSVIILKNMIKDKHPQIQRNIIPLLDRSIDIFSQRLNKLGRLSKNIASV